MDEQLQQQNVPERPASPSQPPPAASERPADLEAQRTSKVQQYLSERLAGNNALASNLGVISADLMGLAQQLKQSIDANLAQINVPQICQEELISGIDTYLRVAKQVERFVQIQERAALDFRKFQPS